MVHYGITQTIRTPWAKFLFSGDRFLVFGLSEDAEMRQTQRMQAISSSYVAILGN
jgi:hypothetical protein